MLDQDLIEKLREVFSVLEQPVTLKISHSEHSAQPELQDMLAGLEQASKRIIIEQSSTVSPAPLVEVVGSEIRSANQQILFRGVPGGHEFSSLVLAILYSDGKGKRPDSGLISRIRQLRGPVRLRTYISLSCENCPEVVQALGLMATIHPNFSHEMVDGAVAQDEITRLGIQGVPAVFAVSPQRDGDPVLLHSGKIQFLDLLTKLEGHFGSARDESPTGDALNLGQYDVVVIGAGPAGASAAIYSARKGLKTAMVAERFGGQLQETKGIENMISVPYTEGAKLAAELNQHVMRYPIDIFEHRRVASILGDQTKIIALESGERIEGVRVIVATGAKWRELGVPGERDYVGRGVAFCAHCDGPFYKGKKVAVVGGGNSGVEAAIDLAGIASEVVLFEYNAVLKADDVLVEKLNSLSNTTVVLNAKSEEIVGDGSKVVGIKYRDRIESTEHQIDVDGVFVQIGLLPNSQFLKGSADLTPFGEIRVDGHGRTSVPGLYAAGDVTTIPFKQIIMAMGDGAKVALAAFEDRMRSSQNG